LIVFFEVFNNVFGVGSVAGTKYDNTLMM